MSKDESKQQPSNTKPPRDVTERGKAPAAALQGRYGSGGSYGAGGGFDDQDGHDSAPSEPDGRAARAARSEAQQDSKHNAGFEREVDPDAAPPVHPSVPRGGEEEELAAKKRRGSRT